MGEAITKKTGDLRDFISYTSEFPKGRYEVGFLQQPDDLVESGYKLTTQPRFMADGKVVVYGPQITINSYNNTKDVLKGVEKKAEEVKNMVLSKLGKKVKVKIRRVGLDEFSIKNKRHPVQGVFMKKSSPNFRNWGFNSVSFSQR